MCLHDTTHQAEPWRLEWFMQGVRAVLGPQRIRNVYVGEMSCVLITASGRGTCLIYLWPAESVDFPFRPQGIKTWSEWEAERTHYAKMRGTRVSNTAAKQKKTTASKKKTFVKDKAIVKAKKAVRATDSPGFQSW